MARAEGFLRHFGDLRLIDVDYDVAREAARIRAEAGLRTPDALILASAMVAGVDMLVTNDRAWKNRIPTLSSRLRLCVMADVVATE